jgi:transcription-repair coupling factor (superfamily II helicase)
MPPHQVPAGHEGLFDIALRPGDAVIHLDYGMARLDGIETVDTAGETDVLCLSFADDARKLVPCADMDRVWRYGAAADVALDRADGSTWIKRRGPMLAGLSATAETLIEAARARETLTTPKIQPSRRRMERFIAGFPYAPTPDQQMAFDAIGADLASGSPMDRLLCGDVGFGKTEAALRAAAAVALAGKQVAILAPTTVLVRQHLATFSRRFAAIGIEVAALSRLTCPAEAQTIRERLADGNLQVVIGTQALAGQDIAFADLALLIVDEEQRFGTKDKTSLAALREGGVHSLTLSATPIPRTLEGALAGLHTLSVLTTPPARRQPVRTTVMALDEAVLKTALLREHARGGQSFCVCPRVADIDDVATLLDRLVPDLSVVILHGKMKPDAVDAALVGFSEGHGDVLLATDIIEAGLDIPRANTIFVWHADQFGLAQLHQLRGRVGRSRLRGMAWLFTDPASQPTEAGAERLDALAAHDGLGAGFAIAARDLDLRGAGDLIGEEQAGHVKLLGVELARHLLGQALARARGEPVMDEWRPEMHLDLPGHIPETYMPDPAARIALYARLIRPHDTHALTDELEDRFGPLPDPVRFLLAQAALRALCLRLGVGELKAGPLAIAADLRFEPPQIEGLERKAKRLLLRRPTANADERLAAARTLLRALARHLSSA